MAAMLKNEHKKGHALRVLKFNFTKGLIGNTNKHSQTVHFCIDGIYF